MNTSSKSSRRAVGVAGTSAVIAVAAALLSQGTANADVFLKLPSQTDVQTLPDGTKVTIVRTNENAVIAPSLGGTPLHRAAQVSAKYTVTTSKKAKIRIAAGYIVGCQVSITGANSGTTGTSSQNTVTSAATQGAGATQTLSLGPGQAAVYYVNNVEKADDFGSQQQTQNVDYETTKASNSYTNEQLQLTGCAGYAQARSYATIRIRTSNVDKQISTYGRPFSIG
ncbi:MAG: MspA family porin [Corynebacteriales bacterium]|uniref:MspA family porin n=1 Tax=Williamsia herbipolensis TaxID=1603258 RepID=A0AAU4K426_9NOCA|nr:MspA family porin [Williamsia herbipolensis]MCX6469516.1 MspA family porin [Mycobacteriales bacterium]